MHVDCVADHVKKLMINEKLLNLKADICWNHIELCLCLIANLLFECKTNMLIFKAMGGNTYSTGLHFLNKF